MREIKAKLEKLGHKEVEVVETYGDGYFFNSNRKRLEPLGYSYQGAIAALNCRSSLDNRKKVAACR